MGNLFEDTVKNEAMDLIIHAGDHAYNEGDDDERRADGYMQAYEQTIANTLWMPIVGNHEYYEGAKLAVGETVILLHPQVFTPIETPTQY